MDEIRACNRRNPHTPHGACLGTAPEFPWEQVEQVGEAWWQCEDCGWTCPANPHVPLEEAECDNCGGELVSAS